MRFTELRLTGRRLKVQRAMLLGLGVLGVLGLAGYLVSSPSEYHVTVAHCRPESHPVYVAASVALIGLIVLAFATTRGRPTVSWLAGIGLLQLCTSGGVGCVAGVRDTLAPLGRTCSTYYHPVDGLGGAFVLLALLIAVPAIVLDFVLFVLEYRRRAAPVDTMSS